MHTLDSRKHGQDKVDRTVFLGVIEDVVQFWNLYQISVNFSAPIYGTPANFSSIGYGVRSHGVYLPGTLVVCYQPPNAPHCYILGAAPFLTESSVNVQPTWVTPYSGVGIKEDVAHNNAVQTPTRKMNFNAGTPYDVLAGEYGFSNPLGILFHIGVSDITLKADELTGLWLFYLSQTTRLAGHNFQHWTALQDHLEGEDEGENFSITQSSPYPWEMRGSLKYSEPIATQDKEEQFPPDPTTLNVADPLWVNGNREARYEPIAKSNQAPISRLTKLGGVLGDLIRWTIAIPPQEFKDFETESFIEVKDRQTDNVGVAEVVGHIDGTLSIASRKSISLVKDCYIPVVKPLKTPNDPTGDSANNPDSEHKFAGVFGSADAPKRTDFKGRDEDPDQDGKNTKIAQLFDNFAWVRHKLTLQNVATKKLDFYVSKPTSQDLIDKSIYVPSQYRFRLNIPSFESVVVDHKSDHTRKLYKCRSAIHMTDDGRVVIEDGWGSQIIMERGNIILTCPGDVLVANGRSFSVLAPKDIHLRAGQHAEFSAGAGDLRIKADKNLHVLAGNSSSGGLLLESRGVGSTMDFVNKYGTDVTSSGIVLKATDGVAAIYGKQVYVRSLDKSDIILDASSGTGTVQTYAARTIEHIDQYKRVLFGTTPDTTSTTSATMEFSESSVIFGQTGYTVFNGSILTVGDGVFVGDISGDQVASSAGGELGITSDRFRNSVNQTLGTVNSRIEQIRAQADDPQKGSNPYEPTKGIGLQSIITSMGFTFRTDNEDLNQYTVNFKDGESEVFWVQARWQQGAEAAGYSSSGWVERAVKSPDGNVDTLPYPGYRSWVEKPLMYNVTNKYWSFDTGESTSYDLYEDARGGSVTPTTLEKGFITSVN